MLATSLIPMAQTYYGPQIDKERVKVGASRPVSDRKYFILPATRAMSMSFYGRRHVAHPLKVPAEFDMLSAITDGVLCV